METFWLPGYLSGCENTGWERSGKCLTVCACRSLGSINNLMVYLFHVTSCFFLSLKNMGIHLRCNENECHYLRDTGMEKMIESGEQDVDGLTEITSFMGEIMENMSSAPITVQGCFHCLYNSRVLSSNYSARRDS